MQEACPPMRRTAVGLLLILVTASMPFAAGLDGQRIGAYNECADSLTAVQPCLEVEGQQVGTTQTPFLYVWLAQGSCLPQLRQACLVGQDPQGPSPVHVVGVLYMESNRVTGLQRGTREIAGMGTVLGDTLLLV